MNDPISDLLTRVRNGYMAHRRFVEVSLSKVKLEIVKILQTHGFVDGHLVKEEKPVGVIRIYLRYHNSREPVVHGLRRESKLSRRVYKGCDEIPSVFGGIGVAILSTSAGILDGKTAREKRVGGELLCTVW